MDKALLKENLQGLSQQDLEKVEYKGDRLLMVSGF